MRGLGRLAAISILVALAIGAAGCGHGSGSGKPLPSLSTFSFGPDLTHPGAVNALTVWPSAMPTDIPALSGHMNMIMKRGELGGSYSVRMFFDGISDGQFEAYVAALKKAGYSLKGQVYYSAPETEEEAEARAARGDYDVWIATRTPRELTLSIPNGSGQVTIDLDGLTQAESDALPDAEDIFKAGMPTPTPFPSNSWPPDWAEVPAPDGCGLGANGNFHADATSLYIACAFPDTDPVHQQAIVDAYKAKLAAAGFTSQAGPATTTMIVYDKGSVTVVLMVGDPEWMTVSATRR